MTHDVRYVHYRHYLTIVSVFRLQSMACSLALILNVQNPRLQFNNTFNNRKEFMAILRQRFIPGRCTSKIVWPPKSPELTPINLFREITAKGMCTELRGTFSW